MGTTTLGQSGPESNGNKGVVHTFWISRTDASLSDEVQCHTQDIFFFVEASYPSVCDKARIF